MAKDNLLELELTLPKPPSLNAFFNGKHWGGKVKMKKEFTVYCESELDKYDDFYFESYEIHIRYNTRHDVDNVILVSKFLSDTLVDRGMVKDDGNKFYKRLDIRVDKDIPKNTCLVNLKCYNARAKEDDESKELSDL
jgi:hypothetical protein